MSDTKRLAEIQAGLKDASDATYAWGHVEWLFGQNEVLEAKVEALVEERDALREMLDPLRHAQDRLATIERETLERAALHLEDSGAAEETLMRSLPDISLSENSLALSVAARIVRSLALPVECHCGGCSGALAPVPKEET